MAESEPQNMGMPPSAGPAQPSPDDRLVRFACRVMLLANLLLAGSFCFLVVTIRNSLNLFTGMAAQLPSMMIIFLSVPASAYCANAAGIVAILILLEAFSPKRKITLVANAAALILFVLATILVEISLGLPMISLIQSVQKQ